MKKLDIWGMYTGKAGNQAFPESLAGLNKCLKKTKKITLLGLYKCISHDYGKETSHSTFYCITFIPNLRQVN